MVKAFYEKPEVAPDKVIMTIIHNGRLRHFEAIERVPSRWAIDAILGEIPIMKADAVNRILLLAGMRLPEFRGERHTRITVSAWDRRKLEELQAMDPNRDLKVDRAVEASQRDIEVASQQMAGSLY